MTMDYKEALTGGHPNSLGNTLQVVAHVLENEHHLDALFDLFLQEDQIVRLRASNALKRVHAEKPEWFKSRVGRLFSDMLPLDQASTQWTLCQMFDRLSASLSDQQRMRAISHMKHLIEHHQDWIVLNSVIEVLAGWADEDQALKDYLKPQLERHALDSRKSVANRAKKKLKLLYSA